MLSNGFCSTLGLVLSGFEVGPLKTTTVGMSYDIFRHKVYFPCQKAFETEKYPHGTHWFPSLDPDPQH
jgi:hypothetical protein